MVAIIPCTLFNILEMKKNIITIGLLLVLTVLTAITSMYYSDFKWAALLILGLSSIKFLLVSFQFMELKEAHAVWKTLVIGYLVVFITIVGVILS